MKIRNGFVSNSSSSSFILPVRSDKDDDVVITITLRDLLNIMDNYTGRIHIISTEEELRKYFIDQYCGRDQTFENVAKDDPWIDKKYKEALFLMNTTGSIMIGNIDNSEYTIMNLIQKAGGRVED